VLRSKPGRALAGKVARVEAGQRQRDRRARGAGGFDHLPAGLSVGELAEVTLSLPPTAKAVLLPNAAIKRRQAQTGVWVIDGGACASRRAHSARPAWTARCRCSTAVKPGTTGGRAQREGLGARSRITVVERWRGAAVISLAGRDILHSWGKFVLTGIGLGLLIGVTLTMAGVYRGMVDDARALLDNSGADLWVVQQDTQGPYAESSSLRDDVVRSVLGLPGVARAANVTYLTMQVRRAAAGAAAAAAATTTCAPWWSASSPASRASRATWWPAGTSRAATTRPWPTCAPACAGRAHPHPPPRLHRGRADAAHGVVGRRPDGLHPAEGRAGSAVPEGQRRHRQRARPHRGQPGLNRPGVPGLLEAIQASQANNRNVNAVLVQVQPGMAPPTPWPSRSAAGSTWRPTPARRWKRSWWPS
jgi:hypothetical protein